MNWLRTVATAVMSSACVLFLGACDELGNPPLRHGHTDAVTWRAPGIELVTSSQTFPSERATELLRMLPRRQLQQMEPYPAVGATVTLVAVELASPRRALPYTMRFLTSVTLPDGRVLRRPWQASGQESAFYSVWVVPQSPTSVITRLR
jgi:hypothetical protein